MLFFFGTKIVQNTHTLPKCPRSAFLRIAGRFIVGAMSGIYHQWIERDGLNDYNMAAYGIIVSVAPGSEAKLGKGDAMHAC